MEIREKKKKKRGLIKYNFRCQITRDGFHFLSSSLSIHYLQIAVVFFLGHRHSKSLAVIPPTHLHPEARAFSSYFVFTVFSLYIIHSQRIIL